MVNPRLFKAAGRVVPFSEFKSAFGKRVEGVRKILAPWSPSFGAAPRLFSEANATFPALLGRVSGPKPLRHDVLELHLDVSRP